MTGIIGHRKSIKSANTHKHHITPKHVWKELHGNLKGWNVPENIKIVTIEEHASIHKALWEEFGRWQDRIAWQGLSGIIGHEAAVYASIKLAKIGNSWNNGIPKTTEHRKNISDALKGSRNGNYGKRETADRMNRYIKCEICGKETNLGNHKRWHGENCGVISSKDLKTLQEGNKKYLQRLYECEYCGLQNITTGNYFRWHGQKCRHIASNIGPSA